MPLKRSGSHEALQSNIREMVRSGHKPKVAVAAALANQRKYKKMAEGGMVDDESNQSLQSQARGSIDSAHDEGEAGEAINPIGMDPEGLSPNVMDEQALASALQKKRYAANDNTHSYEADDEVAGSKMNRGGEVQPEHGMPLGNKPEPHSDGPEEPMADMPMKPSAGKAPPALPELSNDALQDAMAILNAKKEKARKMRQSGM